jgi:hypothetical protein
VTAVHEQRDGYFGLEPRWIGGALRVVTHP